MIGTIGQPAPTPPPPRARAAAPHRVRIARPPIQDQYSKIKTQRPRPGFTLIESMLVTVIVGVGVLAIVAAQQAYHQQNDWSNRVGTALLLANEVRELTQSLPPHDPFEPEVWGPHPDYETQVKHYNDVDDFDGFDSALDTPNGLPIDAQADEIPNMDRWSQRVTVETVPEWDLSGPASPSPLNDNYVIRITCRVFYHQPGQEAPREVTRLTWVRAPR